MECSTHESCEERHAVLGKQVAEIIRREREKLGWTQARLADETGIAYGRVSYIEKGHPGTRLCTLLDILWALDVPEAVCLEIFRLDAGLRRVAA